MEKPYVVDQSSFYQDLANKAVAGAFYTDLYHVELMSKLISFPEGQEVCCLEPSAGDAAAVKTIIKKKDDDLKKIFCVELNPESAEKISQDQQIEKVIDADFLSGVKISHSAFSFCFANPPYGTGDDGKTRLEKSFLEKLTDYLRTDAVLVYVIPSYIMADESFLKCWCSRFKTKWVYRFHEKEYSKWKQVVVFGTKKRIKGYFREEYENIFNSVNNPNDIPLLPENYEGEVLEVLPSSSSGILFGKREFDPIMSSRYLDGSSLKQRIAKKLEQKVFVAGNVDSPPIQLPDSMYQLISLVSRDSSIVGDDNRGDMHLFRGNIQKIETTETEDNERNGTTLIVTESYATYGTILQNHGQISRIK